ncbi:hypothetical protein C8R45DRAFT_1099674 [Mycena sanguinolenta]|nr:hypothetical protein C8R45DRAFT_1099674 [Mycena sanguinolenta]
MSCPPEHLRAQNHDFHIIEFGTTVLPPLTQLHADACPGPHQQCLPIRANFTPDDGIDFVSLKMSPECDALVKKKIRGLYGNSKLGNIVLSNHLARPYADVLYRAPFASGIHTELQRHTSKRLQLLVMRCYTDGSLQT